MAVYPGPVPAGGYGYCYPPMRVRLCEECHRPILPSGPHFHGSSSSSYNMPYFVPYIPDIITWFSYLDRHEVRNKDGIIFAPYGHILKAKRFDWLSQLTPEFVEVEDLQAWLDIEVGIAILIMEYAKEDLDAVRSGQAIPFRNI